MTHVHSWCLEPGQQVRIISGLYIHTVSILSGKWFVQSMILFHILWDPCFVNNDFTKSCLVAALRLDQRCVLYELFIHLFLYYITIVCVTFISLWNRHFLYGCAFEMLILLGVGGGGVCWHWLGEGSFKNLYLTPPCCCQVRWNHRAENIDWAQRYFGSVSYTHLTLPTRRTV